MPAGLSDTILAAISSGIRKAYPIITYNGQDVSAVVFPSLMSLTYKESYKDDQVSDTIDLELADPEGLFRLTWRIASTQKLSLSLVMTNWNGPGSGTITKDCGTMYITAVNMHSDKSKGTTIKLTCSSISPTSSLRLEKKSRAWGQTTVSGVVSQIAADNNLTPKYTPSTDPALDRADQHDHSDAYMLKKLCSENDFSYKAVNGQLWVSSNKDAESQSAIGVITCPTKTDVGGLNGCGITSWEFRENTEDCSYGSAQVSVKDNRTGKVATATAVAPVTPMAPETQKTPILIHHEDIHSPPTQQQDNTDVVLPDD